MSTEFKDLSPEKKAYVSVSANVSRIYKAEQQTQKAVMFMLSKTDDPQAQKLARDLSVTAQDLGRTANYMYHQQKEMEEQYPEFKAERMAIAQQRQQNITMEPGM